MEEFGLAGVADKRAKNLSGGYARRLSVAAAVITEPELLILDEPTLGLDVIARRELWKLIKARKGENDDNTHHALSRRGRGVMRSYMFA